MVNVLAVTLRYTALTLHAPTGRVPACTALLLGRLGVVGVVFLPIITGHGRFLWKNGVGVRPWTLSDTRLSGFFGAPLGRPAPPSKTKNIFDSAALSNSKTNRFDLAADPQTNRDAGPAPSAPGREHEEGPTQRRHGVPRELHRVSSKMDEMRRRRARQR